MIYYYKKLCFIIIVLVIGIGFSSFAQLNLYKEDGIERMGSIDSFLVKNQFDYAIVASSTSSWIQATTKFTCLVKHKDDWYLFRISISEGVHPASGPLRRRPIIRQRKLTVAESDSVLAIIKPVEGMRYSQEELNGLPQRCDVIYREEKATFGRGSDNPIYYLGQRKDDAVVSLAYVDPERYLQMCLPLNAEFGKLSGLVNTFQKLNSIASSMLP